MLSLAGARHVDLMALSRPRDHTHGMGETQFAKLFTGSVDVVFAFHGYPGAVHQLVHGRRTPPVPCAQASWRRERPPFRSTWW